MTNNSSQANTKSNGATDGRATICMQCLRGAAERVVRALLNQSKLPFIVCLLAICYLTAYTSALVKSQSVASGMMSSAAVLSFPLACTGESELHVVVCDSNTGSSKRCVTTPAARKVALGALPSEVNH